MAKLRHDAGYAVWMDPGADKPILEVGSVQCKHCGGHFWPQPGSGKVRGFCFRCNGPICGPNCQVCVPMEQQLENIEAGRPDDFVPTTVNVPRLWTPE